MRWLPSPSIDVPAAGYLVYVRRVDADAYPPPTDVGRPRPADDGTMHHVIGGLDAHASYTVAVSAYSARGAEGARSNEITLPARAGVCAGRAEGAACDVGDLCVPGGCRGGACAAATGPVPGTAIRARLVLRRGAVVGEGAFVTLGAPDPQASGVAVEILGAGDVPLWAAAAPAGTFRVGGRRGNVFRLRAAAAARAGLRRLVLRRRGDVLQVRMRTGAVDGLAAAPEPLTWVVRLGGACVRQVDLRCAGRGVRRRCT